MKDLFQKQNDELGLLVDIKLDAGKLVVSASADLVKLMGVEAAKLPGADSPIEAAVLAIIKSALLSL